jgi:uncharacterized protein YjiS (DUF1127 family)
MENIMALELSGERPSAPASFHPVRTVLGWIAEQRAIRAQRQALAYLMELEHYRLADLGINRADLFDAIYAQPRPTELLAQRRAVRSGDDVNP